ncbi:MAG: hypothetical protein FJY10_09210 [Bacteroidetes bacterium]|nr:hypothetical protein [Bacteroidota bacterium]
MFSFSAGMNDVCLDLKFWVILGIAVFFSFWASSSRIQRWIDQTYDQPGKRSLILLSFLAVVFLLLAEANIVATDFSPFIYFRF